jgi:integrase
VALGLAVGASESNVAQAWSVAHDDYENIVAMARNSNLDILNEVDLQKKARAYLRQLGITPASLKDNPEAADMALGNVLWESGERERNHQSLSNLEKVVQAAYWMAVKPTDALRRKTLLLSECWGIYAKEKEIDVSTREGKRFYNRWKEWLVLTGDGPVSKQLVEEGLDGWVDKRTKDDVSVATIQRELTVVAACIRLATKKTRVECEPFTLPPLKKQRGRKKTRKVLTQETQEDLVRSIISDDEVPLAEGVALLLCLQGAMIASETQRLLKSSVAIRAKTPHLIVTGTTKADARKRIVPLTVGLPWLRRAFKQLDEEDCPNALGSEWARLSDSSISLRMNKYMPNGFTSYSLRHSFRANSIATGAGLNTALIAGWKSVEGVSEIMFDYGQDGLSQSKVLKGLWDTSQQINEHLVGLDRQALRVVK